jgi:endonuclease/exonuclease/phosphatase family metal-dependent hydrolase
MSKGKRIFSHVVWILNILASAALMLGFAAAWISPVSVWWLALFGLAFETLFAINLVFMIYWIVLRNKRFILSLALTMLGLSKIFGIVQVNFSSADENKLRDDGYIKVMSFNVRLFDLYNWFHNNETRHRIFQFLKKESPDVICFQEFYSSDSKDRNFKNEDSLKYYLQAQFSHLEYTVTLHTTDHWGIATFSKYPIINKASTHFAKTGGNIFISSDIKVHNDTIRVYNIHLESIRFDWPEYKFIENLTNEDVEQDEIKGSLTILRHLKKAFVKRATQVDILRDSINESPYKVILCGDFNDTPSSYTYSIVSDKLNDAFRESGNGAGKTYTGPFPSFRIDYIFHDPGIKSAGYRTIREKMSDHYPISCMMKIGS